MKIDTAMSYHRIPILLGVSGKRKFSDDSSENARLLEVFSKRLNGLLTALDGVAPDTPKVLICGGAAGVDLAAARVALARENWSVVLVLPFEREQFERDFEGELYESDLSYFRQLCDLPLRVAVKTLRALHREPFDDSKLEPVDAPRYGRDELVSQNGAKNVPRSWHFEQLGLWLARNSTLLVAGCRAEPSDRLGGTARVVAYRLAAVADANADAVIQRSSELLSNSPFDEPDSGHVLWIDPSTSAPRGYEVLPGVEILRPIQKSGIKGPGVDFLAQAAAIYAAPFVDVARGVEDARKREKAALALTNAFQRAHIRARGWRRFFVKRPPVPAPKFDRAHPAEYLEELRNSDRKRHWLSLVSRQQERAARSVRSALRLSAVMFVGAVAAYEAHTEIVHTPLWLLLYIALLIGIFCLTLSTRKSRAQAISEDFRGLKEMMRVQIAWWSAGIDRMVDRVHLRTVDSNLRLVREAAATVSLWALLRCTRLRGCDISGYERGDSFEHAKKWIVAQANYFEENAEPQLNAKKLAESLFELTFVSAMAALLSNFAFEIAPEDSAIALAKAAEPFALALLAPVAGTTLAVGLWLVTGTARGGRKREKWTDLIPALIAVLALAGAGALTVVCEVQAAARLSGSYEMARRVLSLGPLAGYAPGGLLAALVALGWAQTPDKIVDFKVQEFGICRFVVAVALLAATVALAALSLAPLLYEVDRREATSAFVLSQAVLLLAGSGMARWYTERRNHFAQGVKYDDMRRVFRRAQSWLGTLDGKLDRNAQQKLVDLGELALDENEAWLKAHRERPAEPIAG